MLVLNAQEVRKALPMRDTIEAMKQAYRALSNGAAEVPLRARLPVPPQDAAALFMPAFVRGETADALAVKIVTLFPNNPPAGLPFIHAAVLVMNAANGKIEALLEGGTLTAIRTGAAGGAATDLFARPDSETLAIFGAGVQARTQLEAACTVRRIRQVWVYDPDPERAARLIAEMAGKGPIPTDLRLAASPQQAVEHADIISAATTSRTPVFAAADVRPGTHINGVGSYTPEMVEIPPELLPQASIFIDSHSASLAEAGELIQALERGLIQEADLTEIGAHIAGRAAGRTSPEQITFFKSVGVAVQDAAAAQLALANAQKMNLGQQVDW